MTEELLAYSPSPLRGEGRVRGGHICESPRDYARGLRRRQTDAERRLWARLRDRRLVGAKFARQVPIGPLANTEGVPQRIAERLTTRPSPRPSPRGGEGGGEL